jgi:hypothetical protein
MNQKNVDESSRSLLQSTILSIAQKIQENLGRSQQSESGTYPKFINKFCRTTQMVTVVFST